jgi:hypothetical protein
MRYECIYNPELNAVEAVTHGSADVTRLLEMLRCISELCRQQERANILVDHSDLDAGSLTMENIETLGRRAASLKDILRLRRCAHVVTSDLQFGLVRAWEIIVAMYDLSELETRLFKNRDQAVEWIKAGA